MKKETLRWIEAGKLLAEKPESRVLCPENLDDYLVVVDAAAPGDATLIERHMRCPKCGAYNAMRLHVPQAQSQEIVGK